MRIQIGGRFIDISNVLSHLHLHICDGFMDIRIVGETEDAAMETFKVVAQIVQMLEDNSSTRRVVYEVEYRKWQGQRIPDAVIIRSLGQRPT
jgi:hypothetical protein